MSAASGPVGGLSLLDLDGGEEEELKKLVSHTENILSKLHKVRKEREIVYKEFKEIVHKDDISSLLILNRKVPNIEEQLFKAELGKFQPQQSRIDATIHHQQNLIKELTDTWKSVLANETVRQKTASREGMRSQRQALLERFRLAYHAWTESRDGLVKGEEFYSKLASLANSALANAEQFVNNREEERRTLSTSLNASSQYSAQQLLRDFDSMSIGSQQAKQAPPAPPFSRPTDGYKSTSYQPSGYSFGHESDASVPPTLPPKPGSVAPQTAASPYFGHPREQVPQEPYNVPSAYDSSLYGPSSPYIPSYSYQQGSDLSRQGNH
jgi:FMN-dependent NADH-azoreductase